MYNHDYLVTRIIARAECDQQRGDLEKAIVRYEGFFRSDPTNLLLHDKVAALYLATNNPQKAGRHWYFKAAPTEIEQACIHSFEKSYGNSALLILRNILYKDSPSIKDCPWHVQQRLEQLIERAIEECGTTPKFVQGYKRYFDKKNALKRPLL